MPLIMQNTVAEVVGVADHEMHLRTSHALTVMSSGLLLTLIGTRARLRRRSCHRLVMVVAGLEVLVHATSFIHGRSYGGR